MTQDAESGPRPGDPGRRARRVPTSRADRRARNGARSRGRRKAPQPGRTVLKVIAASLLALGLLTGVGVVLAYNNWNSNLEFQDLGAQLKDRPDKKEDGPQGPINILVMGSDSRSGEGNAIDGESGGGLSDTTILFHLSADRKFAYGISIPRDTAVRRPTCYKPNGDEIAGSEGYVKWNEAFAVGGPACTVQQFEQITGIRVDEHVIVDFSGFKGMVDALDGVEVCIPQDIDDEVRNIHLEAGTREIKGNEALTYVRARYRIGDGTDPNRTRRQQAFIGSMINKALTASILTQPTRLNSFISAATSSLTSSFENIAEIVSLAGTTRGIGADNIKFVTTPWTYSDKVSSGIEWTPEVDKLWQLVIDDRPLTREFLKDSISAGDNPDGSPSGGAASGSAGPSERSSATEESDGAGGSEGPDDGPSRPGQTASPQGDSGMSADAREAAGLCT